MKLSYREAYFTCDLKTRSEPGEGGKKFIEGYFAVYNQLTELWEGNYESIAPGAFTKSLVHNDIRCLFNHNLDNVLGRKSASTLVLKDDEKGLWGRVEINDNDSMALDVYARVQRHDITGCSFGFIAEETAPEYRDGNYYWTIKEADTHEVSICTFPAYPQTAIEARKQSFEQGKKRAFEEKKQRIRKRIGEINGIKAN